jgi:hypothetical protein
VQSPIANQDQMVFSLAAEGISIVEEFMAVFSDVLLTINRSIKCARDIALAFSRSREKATETTDATIDVAMPTDISKKVY